MHSSPLPATINVLIAVPHSIALIVNTLFTVPINSCITATHSAPRVCISGRQTIPPHATTVYVPKENDRILVPTLNLRKKTIEGYFPQHQGYFPQRVGNIPTKTKTVVLETVVATKLYYELY